MNALTAILEVINAKGVVIPLPRFMTVLLPNFSRLMDPFTTWNGEDPVCHHVNREVFSNLFKFVIIICWTQFHPARGKAPALPFSFHWSDKDVEAFFEKKKPGTAERQWQNIANGAAAERVFRPRFKLVGRAEPIGLVELLDFILDLGPDIIPYQSQLWSNWDLLLSNFPSSDQLDNFCCKPRQMAKILNTPVEKRNQKDNDLTKSLGYQAREDNGTDAEEGQDKIGNHEMNGSLEYQATEDNGTGAEQEPGRTANLDRHDKMEKKKRKRKTMKKAEQLKKPQVGNTHTKENDDTSQEEHSSTNSASNDSGNGNNKARTDEIPKGVGPMYKTVRDSHASYQSILESHMDSIEDSEWNVSDPGDFLRKRYETASFYLHKFLAEVDMAHRVEDLGHVPCKEWLREKLDETQEQPNIPSKVGEAVLAILECWSKEVNDEENEESEKVEDGDEDEDAKDDDKGKDEDEANQDNEKEEDEEEDDDEEDEEEDEEKAKVRKSGSNSPKSGTKIDGDSEASTSKSEGNKSGSKIGGGGTEDSEVQGQGVAPGGGKTSEAPAQAAKAAEDKLAPPANSDQDLLGGDDDSSDSESDSSDSESGSSEPDDKRQRTSSKESSGKSDVSNGTKSGINKPKGGPDRDGNSNAREHNKIDDNHGSGAKQTQGPIQNDSGSRRKPIASSSRVQPKRKGTTGFGGNASRSKSMG
jgi:hypothetical protein